MSTATWGPAPGGTRPRAVDVLARPGGADDVRHFLTRTAPARLAALLRHVLPPTVDAAEVPCRLVRSKLKPGHRVTVTFEVSIPQDPLPTRSAVLVWSLSDDGGPTGRSADGVVAAAERHGMLAPLTDLTATDPSGRCRLFVAPFDPAFPQLPGVYAGSSVTRALALGDDARAVVTPIRYRPGQRHVVRLVVGGAAPLRAYVKVYRDDTGLAAVGRARSLRSALASTGAANPVVAPLAYLPDTRVSVWPEAPGHPLGRLVPDDPRVAGLAGATVRRLHRLPSSSTPAVDDVLVETSITRRATAHVAAIDPAAGRRLSALLEEISQRLDALPVDAVAALHGDYKCDNVLVDEGSLHLLDLDRSRTGDPAIDLGKMCADLRWCAGPAAADDAVAAFLDGYGPCPPARLARAACYDVLYQLRAVGRRVPLHEDGWADRVHALLDRAAEVTRRTPA